MLHVMNHDNDLWSALFFSSPIGCYFFFFYWNNNDWTNHLPGLQIVTSLADPFGWKFFKRLCWWILLSSSWGVHKWKCFLRQPLRLSSTTTRVKRKKKKMLHHLCVCWLVPCGASYDQTTLLFTTSGWKKLLSSFFILFFI